MEKDNKKENIDKVLKELGISHQEIEMAGGKDVLDQILWYCEKTNDFSIQNIESTIQKTIQQKIEGKDLDIALQDAIVDNSDDMMTQEDSSLNAPHSYIHFIANPKIISYAPSIMPDYSCKTVKEVYENEWGSKPHPSLKLLIEAFFCDVQEMTLEQEDIKPVLHTIQLLRSYVGGVQLSNDAHEEIIIVYARNMYREFIQAKKEYNDNPMQFLLDNFHESISDTHMDYIKKLPHAAIIKIFAETCVIDSYTGEIEEPLPEEIDLNSIIELIEHLAKIYKIWQ